MVDYHENVYNRRGGDGRDHIPGMPFWIALIRVAQLLLSLLVLCLAAYGSSVFGADYFPGYAMTFFTFSWTILFLFYIFLTPLFYPKFYLYWAHLGLECATTIFWLVAFALLAQEGAAWGAGQNAENLLNSILGPEAGVTINVWPHGKQAIAATKAAAGIGALNWLLFVITLSVFGYFLHKHRVEHGAVAGHRDVEAAEKAGAAPAVAPQQPVEMTDVSTPAA